MVNLLPGFVYCRPDGLVAPPFVAFTSRMAGVDIQLVKDKSGMPVEFSRNVQ